MQHDGRIPNGGNRTTNAWYWKETNKNNAIWTGTRANVCVPCATLLTIIFWNILPTEILFPRERTVVFETPEITPAISYKAASTLHWKTLNSETQFQNKQRTLCTCKSIEERSDLLTKYPGA